MPSASRRAVSICTELSIGSAPGGVDRATWQRLRAGKLPIDRRVDLHAHTAAHAYARFVNVLMAASAQGHRCIEVITGRGAAESGVLKRELPLWLNLPQIRPLVLAAVHPHATNTGAVLLLLRRATRAPVKPSKRP